MATATMATAAGAAALLYYTLGRRLLPATNGDESEENNNGAVAVKPKRTVKKRVVVRPAQAPATWFETISTLSETLRFTYSETLGKWPIGDLAFGINFLLRRQGHLQVASVYAGEDSQELKGPAIVAELKDLLNLLTICIHFSKKPFPLFLEATGYSKEHVLLQEPKAGLLKPAFTILVDDKSHSFLLLIRGTHSIKDTLTAVTGAVVPFHHTVLDEGGVSNLVLGFAHCGMVAAARWIARLATPCLLNALAKYPNFKIKVVGHSLGGGTAALLTYVLRECKEFSSTHCITFAPAACMTWDLAESGESFITSVINGSDLVPTFSATAVDDLRAEVTASAWVNDFREQIERTRFLSTVYRSATALGSRLPSLAKASKARVASAGAIWRPVSNSTQVVMRQAQTMAQAVVCTRPSLGLSGWSCMGARRRTVSTATSSSPAEGESKALMSESSDSVESAVVHSSDVFVHSSDIKTTECAASSSSSVEGNINSTWGRGADLSYSSAPDEEYIDHELDGEEEEDLITSDSIQGYGSNNCDIFSGKWVPDSTYPLYTASACPFAELGFRCQNNGREDKDYLKWRWQPLSCDIPRFNAPDILRRLQGLRVVFVGDSMARTQWESLICLLMQGVADRQSVYEVNGNKIAKRIPYLGVRFSTFNFTIEYYRSPFLVRQGSPPKHAPRRVHSTLKLDKPDVANKKWREADLLVFNAGHWWTPSKTYEMGCYFQVGDSLKLGMTIHDAYRKAISTWASWVESTVNTSRTHVFFRSFEPSHWRNSFTKKVCKVSKYPISDPGNLGKYPLSQILVDVVTRMQVPVTVLNVTTLSAYRSDAHVGQWSDMPSVPDCSHWCLPGVPDMWNELLFGYLLMEGRGVWGTDITL